jgi:hypothetical protein
MATTLFVDVEGIGRFEFWPRTGDKSLAVAAEYHRLSQGQDLSGLVGYIMEAVSHLKMLTKTAPDGWVLDDMDYWSEQDGERVIRVFEGWKAEYARFRGGQPADAEAAGESPS